MTGSGSATASSSHKPMDLPRTMRPREASNAISQSEIAAIRRLPPATARSITLRASIESSELPATSQSHTWVSSRSRSGSDVLLIPGPLRILDRVDDVAAYFDASGHATEEIDRLGFDQHQLSDRLASLGDDDRPALLCHFIHQAQAVGLEFCCGDLSVVHNL